LEAGRVGYRNPVDIDQPPAQPEDRHGLWRELLSSLVLIGSVVFLLLVVAAFGRI
jgi:hypothetical protein